MPTVVEEDRVTQPPKYRPEQGAQVVTGDTARQGPPGKRGLAVLVSSTIGAIVILVIAYAIYAMMS